MKMLLDEMYIGLKKYLEAFGYDVTTVREIDLLGKKDLEIVKFAKSKNMILVTEDTFCSELCDLLNVECIFVSNADIVRVIKEKWKTKESTMYEGTEEKTQNQTPTKP